MNSWTLFLILVILGIILAVMWVPLPYPTHPFRDVEGPHQSDRVETRAAMDIGSGATNLKVAQVDLKTDKIISYLFEKTLAVPYQKHLEQSKNNTFDQEVMNQGIKAIGELKDLASSYGVKKIVAVATAAFRKADNAKAFAQEIEKQTGVKVMIIDQDEEGILAFRGALARTPIMPNKAIVWDIGGGSMQLTTLTKEGTYLIDKGKTASIPFKNKIIQEVKKENTAEVQTPNPLSEQQIEQSLRIAAQEAFATDPYVKEKIASPDAQVISVGNLFNYGVKPLAGDKQRVNVKELSEAVNKLANKSDKELPGGSLAEVAVSNPLLVLGYMQALKINQIDIVNINNADGALTYPAYWE